MVATASRRADAVPAETSRLVGRRTETTAIRQLLSRARLVTLTGVGGVGKTRLAVNVARQMRPAFPGGTYVVPLAELTTPELLPTAVMSRISRTGAASAAMDELAEHIGERALLVVLDNCEHMAEACAVAVGELLRQCPALRVLATSRERLRVDGEAVYAVPPLGLPGENQRVVAADLSRYDALALFVDRASLLHPDLILDDSDAHAIATLCRRLDGLPLAIELMAGRTAALSIEALLERADDQLRVLTAGSRSAPQRHQTLRATLDYSYELCSEPARRLWGQLSVFVGGATLDAVLYVCAAGSGDVEQALSELVDKSIVTFDGSRYTVLETIRAYGIDRLHASGDEAATRRSHRAYFAGIVAGRATLAQLRAEHPNLRAALESRLHDPRNLGDGLSLASALWPFWAGCGLVREGRHWLAELLVRQPNASAPRAYGLWVDGFLAALDGDQSAARDRADECRALAETLGDRSAAAHAMLVRGAAELFDDDLDEAEIHLVAAVALERQLPSPNPVLTTSLIALGIVGCFTGNYEPAIAALGEAGHLAAAQAEELQQSWSLLWSGLVMLLDGRQDEATTLLRDVLQHNRFIGDAQGMSGAVEFLAWAAMERGRDERAGVLLGVSVMLAEATVTHLAGSRRLARWHEARVSELERRLGPAGLRRTVERGRAMAADEGIAFALEESPRTAVDAPGDDLLQLTRREREVALLVASGKSNKEIAAQLVIAERTAETHVEHILSKLGYTSRTQVVALLARQATLS